jgi:hypothetical protein
MPNTPTPMPNATARWVHQLPGRYRMLQPHERVRPGDDYQIGKSYALLTADDWMLPHYDPSGGPFGTFWRAVKR